MTNDRAVSAIDGMIAETQRERRRKVSPREQAYLRGRADALKDLRALLDGTAREAEGDHA